MEIGNTTEGVKQASTFAMEDIRDQFPEAIEKLEDIGGDIIDHLRENRMAYMAVTAGALVLGGAFLLFNSMRAGKPTFAKVVGRTKLNGSRAKRKQARIH